MVLLRLLIVGIKWRRRELRRTRGPAPNRFDVGWRELLDWSRDLGAAVPRGRTRSKQASVLAQRPAGERVSSLAYAADAGVFGFGHPSDDAVAAQAEPCRRLRLIGEAADSDSISVRRHLSTSSLAGFAKSVAPVSLPR